MRQPSRTIKTKYRFIGLLAVALAGFATIIGSGGGGGGAPDTTTPVVYSGVTTIATVTPLNASKLTSDVIGGSDAAIIIGGGLTGVAVEREEAARTHGSGAVDLALHLNRSFREAAANARRTSSTESPVSAVIPVDSTVPCDDGQGTLRIVGTLSDIGTGTVSFTFSSCLIDGVTVSGSGTMRVDAFDLGFLLPTDLTMSFARLLFRAPDLSADVGGSMRVQTDIGVGKETITANLVSIDNSTGESGKSENLVIVVVTTSTSSFTASTSGRVYDQVYGYVDITTPTAFVYSTLTQVYPDSGQMLLTGEGNGSIRVTALSSVLLMLELDLDGNGTPNNTATLKWTELTEPAGSDLGDDDGDGIHNSWELANGLNPADPADAALDHDGDGASSLAEYLAGTDPNDDASTPAAIDLSVTISDAPDPVLVGGNVTYKITVLNNSSLNAFNVELVNTLPTGANFVSATPGQGSCAGTSPVRCDLGTLNAFNSVTTDIIVVSTAEGVLNNTASVTSDSFETNMADNSATSTTTVGQSSAGIQAQIDAATAGDTILVAPGVYLGSINFHGKAITLKSTSGPLVTILDGAASDSVVKFNSGESNGSVLDGFTLQNGSASEGGGISVLSSAPTIMNNIITDNVACEGAGIGLGFASPIIQRNVIRNNVKGGCTGGFGGGGISIRGASAPQILDNEIFGNSSTGGGGISLFAAGTPTIRNNIITGNSGGAIDMVNTSDALIVQNVISGNSSATCGGVSWLVPSGARGPLLVNNTIVDNDGAQGSGICADGFDIQTVLVNNIIVAKAGQTAVYCGNSNDLNPPTFRFNDVFSPTGTRYGGICTDQTGVNNNLSVDPLFVDSSNEDYRLQSTSPVIDAGDNAAPDLPATDIAGNSRIVDGNADSTAVVDMGAYEAP